MKLKDTTVLVTGGCGLIGSTLVDLLLNQASVAEVRILDDLSRGTMSNVTDALATGRACVYRRDIRDFDAMRPLFEDVDVVFHQAALRITACASEPRRCQEVLVDGTYNVVECCVQARVRKLVAASSASVYGLADQFPTPESHPLYNNRTWYGAAKIANEALYRAYHEMEGLPYVALRYFNVYGARMDCHGKYTEVLIRWLDSLARNERPKIFGDGLQTMDFVNSADVARANVLAAEADVSDEVFNVGSGRETSLIELLNLLARVMGQARVEPEYLPERTVNAVRRRLADVDKARRLLGFEAEIDLERGLQQLAAWHAQQSFRRQPSEPLLALQPG